MSDVAEFAPVIEKLLDRTREGKIEWQEQGFGFGTHVKSYEFRVFKTEDDGDITITARMLDDRGSEIFDVRLTDDPQTLAKHRQLVTVLKELFELARRNALNVEQKVEEASHLLDEL
jgi:hypothetical protein